MSIQIVKRNLDTRSFELNEGELERILLAEGVRDREVVVISIAGAFRKGKSFLLNFFIRYLNDKYVKKNVSGNWLGEEEDSLDGFTWRGGSACVTTGIHMWSDVFLYDYDDGRKVAIVVIDTQGTFDTKTTVKDCSTIFALSTLLSSVQIYNVLSNIQENDLQHFQLCCEYGRLVANEGDSPFQKLLFLVRDWNSPWEHEYGQHGGQEKLDEALDDTYEGQEEEHQLLRSYIKKCFNQISCFLMPFPGSGVTENEHFSGKLSDIEKKFKDNLLLLVPLLLAPENLIVKKVCGHPVTASKLVKLFKSYFEVFKSGTLPKPMTLMEATASVHNMEAVTAGKDYYTSNMTQYCSTLTQLSEVELRQQHSKTKVDAISLFEKKQLMGTEKYLKVFIEKLDNLIEAKLMEFLKENKGKLTVTKIIIGFIALVGAGAAAGGLALASPLLMEVLPAAGLPIFAYLLKLITRFRTF